MKISLIAAVAANNVIGRDNDLVWRLPNDFKRFKRITSNHFILMGRKTFESLGTPLPNRTHIVITRNQDYQVPEGHYVFESVEKAFVFCQKRNVDHLYVIGGGEIYRQTLPLADELVLTEVESTPKGDTYFPEFNKEDWKITFSEYHPADDRHQYAFTYVNYERIHRKHV
ncbi:dihydrofolate reductase [Algoriphagus sp. D3-2-R+10]|uniref:dihydrofolate reductase n=1 Tax=Algoriphagus aurantiacus TaxID=3103948 RepID=UPI002B375A8E|nr:dihydrofolate reductase [Algoriphagus sp. D3-2-R+10]MEB2775498.1 dihydrofolate reductase [Algoriphagus sp. D3-2-R+10]